MNNWTLELWETFDKDPETLPIIADRPGLMFLNGELQIIDGDRTVGIVAVGDLVAVAIRPRTRPLTESH